MEKERRETFRQILLEELKPALGCTEPIAIALAGARAREVLGRMPEAVRVRLSGSVIKNVKGVHVPHAQGGKGIEMAAALGILSGSSMKMLEVLEDVREEHVEEAQGRIAAGWIAVEHASSEEGLYVEVLCRTKEDQAQVVLKGEHTRFHQVTRNGLVLDVYHAPGSYTQGKAVDTSLLGVRSIYDYAQSVDILADTALCARLEQQMECNFAIAREGMENPYGARVGMTILKNGDLASPRTLAKAYAAAGSDARMGGSSLPVIINSGSGNQGMTVSIPVLVYGRHLGVSKEKLYRALLLSNLLAVHQKRFIGKLSAFCGVVSASAAAGAAVGYLHGYTVEQISATIINTVVGTGGMLCDGAKPSCALKIAMAVENALLAMEMSGAGQVFLEGDGLVGRGVEETIENIGRTAMQGMRETDLEILRIMTGK